MAKKPKLKRDRIPAVVLGAVDALILGGAEQLRTDDKEKKGWTTDDIVQKVHVSALRECADYLGVVVDDLVARRVPHVLGATPERPSTFWQPLLPNLVLPAFFSIPRDQDEEPDGKGGFRWKRDRDVTINELDRIIEHRRNFQEGYNLETSKYVIVRETATRRGADRGAPISTVMDDDDIRSPIRRERDEMRPPA